MKSDITNFIPKIVNSLLPINDIRGLYILIKGNWELNFKEDRKRTTQFTKINKEMFIHLLFYKPTLETKILILLNNSNTLENGDIFNEVFNIDQNNMDGLKNSIKEIEKNIEILINNEFKEITKKESQKKIESNNSTIENIKIIDMTVAPSARCPICSDNCKWIISIDGDKHISIVQHHSNNI